MKLIKEIADYQKLREDLNNLGSEPQGQLYTVYKATGMNTEKTFYGWVQGTGEEAIRKAFNVQANRQGENEDQRGVQRLVAANGGDADEIEFEELAVVDNAIDAHQLRNDERAADPESVTDPSPLPANIHTAAKAKHPERYAEMQRNQDLKKIPTARQAYAAGYFSKDQIMGLKGHPEAKADLDRLSPFQFRDKYHLQFTVK